MVTTALCWGLGIVVFNSDYAFTVTNVIIHGVPYMALVYPFALLGVDVRAHLPRILIGLGLFVFLLGTIAWFHAKLVLVVILSGFTGLLARWTKEFAADRNTHSQRFYRIANEVPTLLMIAIVILVVVRPF